MKSEFLGRLSYSFLHVCPSCNIQLTQPLEYNVCIRNAPEDAREEWEEVDEVVAVAGAELDVLGHDLRRVVVHVQLRQGELTPVRKVGGLIQGTSKERFPGCVKLGEKLRFVYLLQAGERNFFHLIFTQPGAHLLEHPSLSMLLLLLENSS